MEILIPPIRGIKCKPVKYVSLGILDQAKLLSQGFGLAAPQLGIFERWFLWFNTLVINPKVHWTSQEKVREMEGCLSLPGIRRLVTRPKEIIASWHDNNHRLSGFEARVFLHELVHLNGVFIDDLEIVR